MATNVNPPEPLAVGTLPLPMTTPPSFTSTTVQLVNVSPASKPLPVTEAISPIVYFGSVPRALRVRLRRRRLLLGLSLLGLLLARGFAAGVFAALPGSSDGGAASADPVSAASASASANPAVRRRLVLVTGYPRKTAPKRRSSASVIRARKPAASSSESVRSGDWKLTANAIDFFPGPTCSPR